MNDWKQLISMDTYLFVDYYVIIHTYRLQHTKKKKSKKLSLSWIFLARVKTFREKFVNETLPFSIPVSQFSDFVHMRFTLRTSFPQEGKQIGKKTNRNSTLDHKSRYLIAIFLCISMI